MIGIIRVRLSVAPNEQMWSDREWQTLMDPAVQLSLGNYWRKCLFGLADLSYRLFPAVTVNDPQPTMTPEEILKDPQFRSARVRAITKVVDEQHKPDWGSLSTLLIWVASPLDLWGSSLFDHGKGTSAVMMCDSASRFDQICHELGHTLGFDHPFGREGLEYNSAYDIMGGYDSEWTRPVMMGLPAGNSSDGTDPMRLTGPMISAAQLSMSGYYSQLSALFKDLPANIPTSSQSVVLQALDGAADKWPQVSGSIGAILPPDQRSPDYHYVIELRRSWGYDKGVRPAIVVHGYEGGIKRFFFAGALPLTDDVGDTDLHVFSGLPGGDITVRLLEVGPNDAWARIQVGGANYWRNYGVDVMIEDDAGEPRYTDWQQIDVRPCGFAELGTHSYRYKIVSRTFKIDARSFGYETPGYVWRLEGTTLQASGGSVTLDLMTSVPDPLLGWQSKTQSLVFHYKLHGSRLELEAPRLAFSQSLIPVSHMVTVGKLGVALEVTVNETSPGVLKNNYPERSVTTSLLYPTVEIEWDQAYRDALSWCKHVVDEVNRKHIPIRVPRRPDGDPEEGLPNILDVVTSMLKTNPAVANTLIEHLSRTANISTLEVIARLQSRR